jgi:hypothetical protein
MNNKFRIGTIAFGTLVAISALFGCTGEAALADVTNRVYRERSTGTRDASGSSFLRGNRHSITTSESFKLDFSGAGAKGDIYYRNGQLSGAGWSLGDNGDDPNFVAGKVVRDVTIENVKFGSQQQFGEWSSFTGELTEYDLE